MSQAQTRHQEELEADTAAERETETPAEQITDEVLSDDLLVEEVSIDGMCGVY